MAEDDWIGPKNAGMTKVDWSLDGTTWLVIPEVRNVDWGIDKEAKEYASSSTNGRKRKRYGQGDEFDGSLEVYQDDGEPLDAEDFGIRNGAEGYFRVREGNQDGSENTGSNGRTWVLPVTIGAVEYEHNIEDDELVGVTVNFDQNGDITYPEAA